MKFDFRQLSPKALWRRQTVRAGAGLTLIGGAIGVIANLTAVVDIFAKDETAPLVEETRVAVASTDAKVDEILKLMRMNASLAGADFDPQAEGMMAAALEAILTSGDTRKAAARKSLEAGDVAAAAAEITKVAREQADAAGGAARAAAESWREAGALYAASDTAAAIDAYEKALALDPGDFDADFALAALHHAVANYAEAEKIWKEALARAAPGSVNSGRAIYGLGAIDDARGDAAAAEARFREALAIARKHRNASLASVAANGVGVMLRRQGRVDDAEEMLRFSLEEGRRSGTEDYVARALTNLGLVAFTKGDPEAAVSHLEEAQTIYEGLSDLRRQSKTIGNLGAIALERGDLEAAENYIHRSIAIGEKLNLRQSIAEDLINLADLALRKGELAAAERHLARAFLLVEEAGLQSLRPYVETTAGQLSAARGDKKAACAHWERAISGLASMMDATEKAVAAMAGEAGCFKAAPSP